METRSRRAAATTFLPILAPSIFSPLLVPSFVFFFFLLVFEERGGSMGRRDCGLGLRFFRVGA